jgi:hypothetical protein
MFGKKADPDVLVSYSVIYLGGHADYPQKKSSAIDLKLRGDRFDLEPTMSSKRWFSGLSIPYSDVVTLEITQRQVSTGESLLGGLNSRQLNQANNIHITYDGQQMIRLEMLSGVTVMGQAKKCLELQDRLRIHGITAKFRGTLPAESAQLTTSVPSQIAQLAELVTSGVLSQDEFEHKKVELLGRM